MPSYASSNYGSDLWKPLVVHVWQHPFEWTKSSPHTRYVCSIGLLRPNIGHIKGSKQRGLAVWQHITLCCLTQLQMFLLREALSNESDSNRKAAPSTSDPNNKQKVNIRPSCTYDVLERMHVVYSCFSRSVNWTDVDQSPSSGDVRHCYRWLHYHCCSEKYLIYQHAQI